MKQNGCIKTEPSASATSGLGLSNARVLENLDYRVLFSVITKRTSVSNVILLIHEGTIPI